MADSVSTKELVKRAVAGERFALQRLLTLHHDRLAVRIDKKIPALLRSSLSTEDICQEAYIVAFQQVSSFRSQGADGFYNWLATVAERKLVDAIRAQRAAKRSGGRVAVEEPTRSQDDSMIALIEMLAVHERTPSRSAASHEAVAAVQAGLEQLKDDYREVIRLRHIEGLPMAEVAERMGRSQGAAQMLARRALEQLSDAIGDPSRFFSHK